MPCVSCRRPLSKEKTCTIKFLCWYCRATRVGSAAQLLLNILDEDGNNPAKLKERTELLRSELANWYFGGMSIGQLKKPTGLEE